MKRTILLLFLFALLGIVLVTFVLTPFTGDIYVFMGSAHQMEFFDGNFLERAFHTWDVKGIFARTFLCLLYRSAVSFADFASLRFEIIVRSIYLTLSLAVLFLSAKLIYPKTKQCLILFLSLSLGLFATHYASHLQHEMTTVLLMILSYALLISKGTHPKTRLLKDFFAGLLLGCLPYFKSIFIILPPMVISAVYLVQPNIISICRRTSYKRLYALILGGLIMGLSGLSLILFLYPEEIQDILDVSAFQNTLLSGGLITIANSLYFFIYGFFCQCLPMNPIVTIGSVTLLINTFHAIKSNDNQSLFHHFFLWTIPMGFILLSNRFFAYHYYLFTFPALIESLVYAKHLKHGKFSVKVTAFTIFAIAILFYIGTMSIFSANFRNYVFANNLQHRYHLSLHKQFPKLRSNTILYLDGGAGSYLAGGQSHLKYIYPLPLQRIGENSKFHNLPCRLECKIQALRYKGKYVILDEQWFGENEKNQEIIEKIKNEYDLVGYLHYVLREWKIFGKPEYTDRILGLYARKPDT